ncbi:WYL domain-containing protein [Pseudoalteromonas piscicida]|uniref:WYL domain-containing protein n=1 Tax=Pseudoalteromonas piscicida TaxID=43662 RepID=UPI0027E5000D|nr:WYL domain-containing protein [Pseudoalteromonas piscicida]WMO15279.1 WYL domain-containing protein [Pseudoalteromonas piscicida]
MNNHQPEIAPQVRERLSFIDFYVFFLGKIGRKDLIERFGISAPAATRDFRLYNEIAPNNLIYRPNERAYVKADEFKLLTPPSVEKCLSTLSFGFGDFEAIDSSLGICESSILGAPNLQTLAVVTRTIHNKKSIKIKYFSHTSGESLKEIVPHTLVNTGMRWHCRAWDRDKQRFSDFVINRIIDTFEDNLTPESKGHELKVEDKEWNTKITLVLVPHPRLAGKSKPIELDYNMSKGQIKVESRLATASYLLVGWDVDYTENAIEKREEYRLALHNRDEIYKRFGKQLFLS